MCIWIFVVYFRNAHKPSGTDEEMKADFIEYIKNNKIYYAKDQHMSLLDPFEMEYLI